jgi:hypothetical protein
MDVFIGLCSGRRPELNGAALGIEPVPHALYSNAIDAFLSGLGSLLFAFRHDQEISGLQCCECRGNIELSIVAFTCGVAPLPDRLPKTPPDIRLADLIDDALVRDGVAS